jgi:hypothetical protein
MKPRLFKPLIFANKNLNPDRIGLEDLSPLAVKILVLFLSAVCLLPSPSPHLRIANGRAASAWTTRATALTT